MKTVIIGAGRVGRSVARVLAQKHDIIVIDHDAEALETVRFESDVMTYEGNGADLDVLEGAGVSSADLVVGSTSDDRSNILICNTAKALNEEVFTVARVAETEYLATWSHLRKAFNVDFMVGEDYLTAQAVARVGGFPGAQHVELFCKGRVEMAELEIPEGSSLAGRTVQEANLPRSVNLAAVFSGNTFEIARGGTRLDQGRRLIVFGRPDDVQQFGRRLSGTDGTNPLQRAMIFGGGEIGYQTARLLEQRGAEPKLVEQNPERARFLAENLPNTIVLQNDATDPEFLQQEGAADADVLISALTPDERNLLTALLSKRLGTGRAISVVHDDRYESTFENNGIDVTINPRREVIEEILRFTRGEGLEKVTFIEHHRGEVIEVELGAGSSLVGRPLQEAASEMPRDLVVGAIARGERIVIPRGDTTLEAGDHLVVFVDTHAVDQALEVL